MQKTALHLQAVTDIMESDTSVFAQTSLMITSFYLFSLYRRMSSNASGLTKLIMEVLK